MQQHSKIALLTDSCADLTEALRREYGIFSVPLRIRVGEREFRDGVDITANDVYGYLRAGQLPQTSLPVGEDIEAALCAIRDAGYDSVIAVLLSGGLSGTSNVVRLTAESFADRLDIRVYDSLSGSLGQGMIVLQLAQEIRAGASWEELTERRVPHLIRNTFAFFSLNTLEYLEKGGRIGKVTAVAGTLLHIKPILTFAEDGQLKTAAKVRGQKQIADRLVSLCTAHLDGARRYNLAVANGGAAAEMEEVRAKLTAALPEHINLWPGELDGTLSCYIGDGVLGAAIQLVD